MSGFVRSAFGLCRVAANELAPQAVDTSSPDGTGVWLRIAFESPVSVQPDTPYDFDVTSTTGDLFLETHGIRDAAAGGNPYAVPVFQAHTGHGYQV